MSELIRSFIAFDVESEDVRRNISSVQSALVRTGAKLRLVDPEAIHLTVKFLGEIPQSLVERVKQALAGIKFKAFTIELAGLGAFPTQSHPSVIWIGIRRGSSELTEVFREVEARVTKLGIPPERREFSPHLTIARVKARNPQLVEAIAKLSGINVGSIEASALKLKRSILTRRGPVYSTLLEVQAE